MDLIEFLNARLDEDEEAAKATVEPHRWHLDHFSPGELGAADETHIARHDPARVLREVEAKRLILARYQDALARMEDPLYSGLAEGFQIREYEDFVLPDLAAIYSDHPDYRPEWKP